MKDADHGPGQMRPPNRGAQRDANTNEWRETMEMVQFSPAAEGGAGER
jgi:hypothetical protein